MSRDLLSAFMRHLDEYDDMELGDAPREVQTWLKNLELPRDISEFLQFDWPQKDTEIAHISLFSSTNILQMERTQALLTHGFLLLGHAPNGDDFVIDFSTAQCQPGFISHEEYYEHEDAPRNIFQPIARSFESLLHRIVDQRFVPIDYFNARDYNEFLDRERKSNFSGQPRVND